MYHRYRLSRAAICIAAVLALACPMWATEATKQLVPGVSLYQDVNTNRGSELIVSSITVDLAMSGVDVKAALGKDVVCTPDPLKGRENVGTMTARRGAIAGINCDFFPWTGDPLGTCVIDGEFVSEPTSHKATLAILSDHTAVFDNPTFDGKLTLAGGIGRQVDGINRDRATNQVVLYTPIWGKSTYSKYPGTDVVLSSTELPVRAGKPISFTVTEVCANAKNTAIPEGGAVLSAGGPAASFLAQNLKPGDKLSIVFEVKSSAGVDWTQVQQSVSGGPWLLKDGKQFIDLDAEGMGASFSNARHPRSAVGLTSDGKLMLVTVDGRQTISRGISLPDLSDVMKRLGAVNAINLDGGGSTTLSYRGIIINSPSGGEQRPVANALLVFSNAQPAAEVPGLAISGLGDAVIAGQPTQLSVSANGQPLPQDQLDNVVWGTANGGGFVNQKGYLTPVKLRRESIKAYVGSQLTSSDVKVVAGIPSSVEVALAPDKTNPLLSIATISVIDANSNPCSNKAVTLAVTGGKADMWSGITNERGELVAKIAWDANASERVVKAASGNLSGSAKAKSEETK